MLRVKGKEIDFRVSTVPTIHGESIVLRILDKSSIVLDIQKLGFGGDTLGFLSDSSNTPRDHSGHRPHGKRKDHHSLLRPGKDQFAGQEDHYRGRPRGVSAERDQPDPGEAGDRPHFRERPALHRSTGSDVILIGEIRDAETADIAIHSALTGHLVLSTLHTNDAPSAITRLINMGMEDYLLSSTVIGILAQRLVRAACPYCQVPSAPTRRSLRR